MCQCNINGLNVWQEAEVTLRCDLLTLLPTLLPSGVYIVDTIGENSWSLVLASAGGWVGVLGVLPSSWVGTVLIFTDQWFVHIPLHSNFGNLHIDPFYIVHSVVHSTTTYLLKWNGQYYVNIMTNTMWGNPDDSSSIIMKYSVVWGYKWLNQ